MKASTSKRYALWSGTITGLSVLSLLPYGLSQGAPVVGWLLLGWIVTAVPGVLGGAWAATEHGRPGAGFVVAVGACMLTRLFGAAAGAAAAAATGGAAIWPYLLGLAAGFVPLQVFEIGWFIRRARVARGAQDNSC